ncbi:hypothetical protein [Mucilaginibacter antarcticus]
MFWAKTPAPVELAGNKKPVQQPVTKSSPLSVPQNGQPSVINTVTPSTQHVQIAAANKIITKQSSHTGIQLIDPTNAIIATAKPVPSVNTRAKFDYTGVVKPDSALIANNAFPPVKRDAINGVIQNPLIQKDPTGISVNGSVPDKAVAGNPISKPAILNNSVYDNLVKSRANNAVAAVEKSDKDRTLSYSVVVQPGIGNQKINMGTGVQVAYKLNDKFSITSGVSYSSLSATGPGTAASTRLGNVQNVNLAVSGVEIPLGVQYKTGKGYYVSAGVMGMSVTSNSMQYSYISQGTVATTMIDKQGSAYSNLSVAAEQKTEDVKEKFANYLGFYIISAGKKQPIGKKNNIIFGPFLRVPFGAVSSEKIRLLQGGVTVGFGF